MSKSFFDEIDEGLSETKNYDSMNVLLLGVGLGVILLWVYNTFLQSDPVASGFALTYIIMLIVWGINLNSDLFYAMIKRPNQTAANGLGKKDNIVTGLLIGFGLGFLLVFGVKFSVVPFSIVDAGMLSFLFVVICAPIIEANFFRGLLQPILTLMIEQFFVPVKSVAWVVALVIQSLAFALFHINIVNASGNFWVYVLFAVICTVLVYATRSIASEWGLHGVNNLFAWVAM